MRGLGFGLGFQRPTKAGIATPAPWYDDTQYDLMTAGADFNNDRYFLPASGSDLTVGGNSYSLTKVGGKYPKRSATFAEWFAFTASSTAARTYTDSTGVVRDANYAQNLLLQSGDLTSASWDKVTTTVIAGVADPLGGTAAHTLTAGGASSLLYQIRVGSTVSVPWTASIWIRRRTGTGNVYLHTPTNAQGTALSLTSSWQQFQQTASVSGNTYFAVELALSGDAVDVFQPQLEPGSTPTAFKLTTTTSGGTDKPRLTYANGKRQLRLEDARTNVVPYSQDFSNALWLVANGSSKVGASATLAPDGTATAYEWAAGTQGGASGATVGAIFKDSVAYTAGTYTGSCYVRTKTGTSSIRLGIYDGSDMLSSDFAIDTTWRRVVFSRAVSTATGNFSIRNNVAGNTGDVLIWGAQLEVGAFASDYIPTTSAAVTRTIETARFSLLMEAIMQRSAASIVVRCDLSRSTIASGTYGRLLGSGTDSTALLYVGPSNEVGTYNNIGLLPATVTNNLAPLGAAMAFDGTGRSAAANGGAVSSDAGVAGSRSVVYLGRPNTINATDLYADGYYDFVGVSPERLTNTQLQALAVAA